MLNRLRTRNPKLNKCFLERFICQPKIRRRIEDNLSKNEGRNVFCLNQPQESLNKFTFQKWSFQFFIPKSEDAFLRVGDKRHAQDLFNRPRNKKIKKNKTATLTMQYFYVISPPCIIKEKKKREEREKNKKNSYIPCIFNALSLYSPPLRLDDLPLRNLKVGPFIAFFSSRGSCHLSVKISSLSPTITYIFLCT